MSDFAPKKKRENTNSGFWLPHIYSIRRHSGTIAKFVIDQVFLILNALGRSSGTAYEIDLVWIFL